MAIPLKPGDAVMHEGIRLRWYRAPAAVHEATHLDDVVPCLHAVAADVARGLHAVGFVAYEAAPAFDSALAVHPATTPLCWFGLYDSFEYRPTETAARAEFTLGPLRPRVNNEEYAGRIARIREWIAGGDTYQVNYTFPLEATFAGDAFAWFLTLAEAQHGNYSTLIHTGPSTIVSVSPELFFSLRGNHIETRPMKGTWKRGLWPEDDAACAQRLAASEKDRAENIMIVDMMRHDLGRIADVGSVRVENLFRVERYPTLWQMTSTVRATTRATVPEVFAALFPSASVTGAPKVRTMQIIHELEREPRGVYCGAVGHWTSDESTFAVAIRTAVVDHATGTLRYSVGSGITWDSDTTNEYKECLLKADVLRRAAAEFSLLETLRWDGAFDLLAEHLDRMAASADYFDIPFDREKVLHTLNRAVADASAPLRVRLLLDRTGIARAEARPLGDMVTLRICLAAEPIARDWPLLYHKTTQRAVYDAARAANPTFDDVLLWNEHGEITESTIANVVVRFGNLWYTPPIHCGLLAGTFRTRLLRDGAIRERVILRDELQRADEIQLINCVRGWIRIELTGIEEGNHAGCD